MSSLQSRTMEPVVGYEFVRRLFPRPTIPSPVTSMASSSPLLRSVFSIAYQWTVIAVEWVGRLPRRVGIVFRLTRDRMTAVNSRSKMALTNLRICRCSTGVKPGLGTDSMLHWSTGIVLSLISDGGSSSKSD